MLCFTSQHHKFSGNQNEALKFKHRSLNKDGRCVALGHGAALHSKWIMMRLHTYITSV